LEQIVRHHDLGHLEDHGAVMAETIPAPIFTNRSRGMDHCATSADSASVRRKRSADFILGPGCGNHFLDAIKSRTGSGSIFGNSPNHLPV
jgi:hypothetical protein